MKSGIVSQKLNHLAISVCQYIVLLDGAKVKIFLQAHECDHFFGGEGEFLGAAT